MKLNEKKFKWIKIRKYLKNNNLLFFNAGKNQTSSNSLMTKQKLKKIGLSSSNVSNQIITKILTNSIIYFTQNFITGSTTLFFQKIVNLCLKHSILNVFNSFTFELVMLKLNNKTYTVNSLKRNYSLNYKETKLVLWQFLATFLKSYSKFSK
jgi:hypothetical protein